MRKFLNVMDYKHTSHETDIPVADVDSLYVVVLTGDEVVQVNLKDGSHKVVDAIGFLDCVRADDYFDGDYGVHKDDLEEWLERKDSYEWFGRMLKNAEV